MSIRKHILTSLFFVLFLTFISLGTSIYYLQKIGATSTQILQEDYRSVKAAEELNIALVKIDRALVMLCLDSVATAEEEKILLKIVESEHRVIASSYLTVIRENAGRNEAVELYQTLAENYTKYRANTAKVADVQDRDKLYMSLLRWQNEVLRSSCSKVVESNHANLKEKNQELQRLYLKAKINTFLACILMLLVVAVVMNKIPDRIIRPIGDLTEKVRNLVQGGNEAVDKSADLTADRDLMELASSINLAGQRLKETEEKFWLITENLYDLIFFCTPDGKIFYTTPSIQRVLGYSPEEMIGKMARELVHPNDVDRLEADAIENTEARVKTKAGKYIWLEANRTFHQNAEGKVLYAQYTARDITKRKKAEQKIKRTLAKEKKLNEELTKTNDELDKLVYSASHNLRAPLTSILGLLSLLRLASRKAERTEMIDRVETSVHQLDETVKDIVEYSRNTRIAVEVERVDFEEVIVNTMRDLQYLQPEDQPVNISYDIDPDVRCYSDTKRLKIVFLSLISNAIKYRDQEKSELELQIKVSENENHTLLTFTDNGIGIKEELQEKIFDMFYRGSEQAGGAGLGLYIVKNSVEKVKGTITLQSECKKGTVITIVLPNLEKTIVETGVGVKAQQLY